jgi:predicted lactoylglutathione lyase
LDLILILLPLPSRQLLLRCSTTYIHVTEAKFKIFTPKEICDATKYSEVLVCLTTESREKVDEIVLKAVATGGSTYNQPQDHGFMYGHGFQDLDGHIWELNLYGAGYNKSRTNI